MTTNFNVSKRRSEWSEFEHVMADLQKMFNPGAVVKHDDKILGDISKRSRQIDISIRSKVGPYDLLFVVDCKKRNKKIDSPAMSAFVGLKEDVGAHLGIMINEKGYSKGALNIARAKGVQAFTYRDTKKQHWAKDIRINLGMQFEVLIPLKCAYQAEGEAEQNLDNSSILTDLHSGKDLGLTQLLNEHIFCQGPVKIGQWEVSFPTQDKVTNRPGKMTLGFQIDSQRYINKVGLDFLGLFDHRSGKVHLNSFELPPIVLNDIEKHWKKLTPDEDYPRGVLCMLIRTAANGKLLNGKVVPDFKSVEMRLAFNHNHGTPFAMQAFRPTGNFEII